jgi:hypothetical protein
MAANAMSSTNSSQGNAMKAIEKVLMNEQGHLLKSIKFHRYL